MRLFAALFVLVSELFVASPLTPALGAGADVLHWTSEVMDYSKSSLLLEGGKKLIEDASR